MGTCAAPNELRGLKLGATRSIRSKGVPKTKLQAVFVTTERWDRALRYSPEDYLRYIAVGESVLCRPRLHLTAGGENCRQLVTKERACVVKDGPVYKRCRETHVGDMQDLGTVLDLDKSRIHRERCGINPSRWTDGYIELDGAAWVQLET